MLNPPFEEIWDRIVANAGQTFHTVRGLPFTFKIRGNGFYPNRTDYRISKSDFRKAYQWVPVEGPGEISEIVRGPSYVWAVLHDPRISLDQW